MLLSQLSADAVTSALVVAISTDAQRADALLAEARRLLTSDNHDLAYEVLQTLAAARRGWPVS
ncbi:hypothetical protein [Deinococcus hohokamensis]|uniref:ANTAR domain-containing protein n=1 Tax=Deinococcus hohokamensis TaxID=309883 RepID=A0ABV9I6T8_9DEIO